jgi:hypothetical protein
MVDTRVIGLSSCSLRPRADQQKPEDVSEERAMRTCLRNIAFPGAMLLLFAASSAWGQTRTTGSIAGVVADPSGAVVPDARVALRDVARGATYGTVSSKQGEPSPAYKKHPMSLR